jgi:hypothetical protein
VVRRGVSCCDEATKMCGCDMVGGVCTMLVRLGRARIDDRRKG